MRKPKTTKKKSVTKDATERGNGTAELLKELWEAAKHFDCISPAQTNRRAFYDAVAENYNEIYGQEFLRGLIHDTVQSIRRNLKVDWTSPHREDVKAQVRASVRRVLRQRGVKAEDLDQFLERIMGQAEALYAEWPLAA